MSERRATMDDYQEISEARYAAIIASAGHPADVNWPRVSRHLGGLLYPASRTTLCFSCGDKNGVMRFYVHRDAQSWLEAA